MIDLLAECERLMNGANLAAVPVEVTGGKALAFEGMTVLGFVFAYDDATKLIERWRADSKSLIEAKQLPLRRAEAKAWNTYTVFLARAPAHHAELVALNAIEEDLIGTRKIARAGIGNIEDLRVAILSLLPIQNAPRLEAIDMGTEIRLRTTELPQRIVEAFLSDAQDAAAIQVLEEEP